MCSESKMLLLVHTASKGCKPLSLPFWVSAPGQLMAGHCGLVLALAGQPGAVGRAHPGDDHSSLFPP